MICFLDTSALVKLFHQEEGSERIVTLYRQGAEIWISDLARLEIVSALYRRFRNHELDEIRLHTALSNFEAQLTVFHIEPISQLIMDEAMQHLKRLGKHHGLRTLDAIHLATFCLISESSWSFIAADNNLLTAAAELGFSAYNPTSPDNWF